MPMILDQCEGCPDGTPPFDHRHQYISFLGHVVTTYTVDGMTYTDLTNAMTHCVRTYGVDRRQAMQFLFSLRLKIN